MNIDLQPPQEDDVYWYTDPFAGGMPTVPAHDHRWYPYVAFIGSVLTVIALAYLSWLMSRNGNPLI